MEQFSLKPKNEYPSAFSVIISTNCPVERLLYLNFVIILLRKVINVWKGINNGNGDRNPERRKSICFPHKERSSDPHGQ